MNLEKFYFTYFTKKQIYAINVNLFFIVLIEFPNENDTNYFLNHKFSKI